MADEQNKPIDINALTRESLLKLPADKLEELHAYMVTIRMQLAVKMELVHAVKEEVTETERMVKELKAKPAPERERLKQVLNGDHFKEAETTPAGDAG